MAKKLFVLDTNVILHDHQAIFCFEENDIVLPITVLEELDKFKKGSDQINFQAREFMRELDKLVGDILTPDGVALGPQLGRLYIETRHEFPPEMQKTFSGDTMDNRIIAVAVLLKNLQKQEEVVMVSKDINVRVKAKALGIKAQDYKTGKVEVKAFAHAAALFENQSSEAIAHLYSQDYPEGVDAGEFNIDKELFANQYMIVKAGDRSSALAYYHKEAQTLRQVPKIRGFGITPRNAEQAFAMHACLNDNLQLVSFTGKAGTGKTLIALAAALEQADRFDQVFLARPIVALSNRDLGYLPGSAEDKINPYMQPLFDNLSVIKQLYPKNSPGYEKIMKMQQEKQLLIEPLAYIRGRTLSRVFFIVDEAQNLTPHEVKTIITRAGEGTKIVFTGDIQQIDSPFLDSTSNGLAYLTHNMRGQEIFGHVHLIKGERSKLAELASNLL